MQFRDVCLLRTDTGDTVPIFDITKYYQPNDTRDSLVCNQRLGAALATEFEGSPIYSSRDGIQNVVDTHHSYPAHNLVLMQSHGFAAVAGDIKIATYQGIYAVTNAKVQSEALKIQHSFTGKAAEGAGGIVSLDERQIRESWATERRVIEKPWAQWVKEVRVDPLYVNEVVSDTCG